MSEELKNIEESFEILTEEENRIKSKSTLNSEDERDLEAIKSLREEFINLKNQILLSQYKARLQKIESISKKQYPKLEGKDKTNKKEILKNLGFISINGFDNREVFIARDLANEYSDLVDKTKPLVEEQNQKFYEIRKAEELVSKNQTKISDNIISFPSQNLNENNDLPRTFTINMAATHENDEYRKNGISVIEPNLGVKLEDFANEIAGKPYITNFNNFEIDAKNYQTGAEIVEAYDRYIQQGLNSITPEQEIDEIHKKIIYLLENASKEPNQGKKSYITFENKSYEFPKKRLGELKTLQTQYFSLRKKLNSNNKDNVTSIDNFMNTVAANSTSSNDNNNSIPDLNHKADDDFIQSVLSSIPGLESSKEPGNSDIEESSNNQEDEEFLNAIFNSTPGLNLEDNKSNSEIDEDIQVIDIENNRTPRTPKEAYDWKKEETNDYKGVTPGQEIMVIKQPKNKSKIKEWLKIHKNKIKRAIIGVVAAVALVAGTIGLYKHQNKTIVSQITEPTTSSFDNSGQSNDLSQKESQTYIIPEEEMDEVETSSISQENPENYTENITESNDIDEYIIDTEDNTRSEDTTESNDYEEYNIENQDILIGSKISINEDSKIYTSAGDAILEENAYKPYYDNNIDRVALGVSIEYNDQIINVLANTENANNVIQSLLNDGGKIVSVLTANVDKLPQDYDGNRTLTAEEINKSAEGFYNAGSITNTNERGMSR